MSDLVRFEPGDLTSYRVLFRVLTDEERSIIAGTAEGAVLFGFGLASMSPLPVSVFQPAGFLDRGYYVQRMGDQQHWTTRAGMVVLSFLTDRPIDPEIWVEITNAWRLDWPAALRSLRVPEGSTP